jgi:8-oxo-dGTP diphosphatase
MLDAAFIIICRDDQILLVKSLTNPRFQEHWSLPGGLVDPGETPAQAAVREASEEVGIACTVESKLADVANEEDGVYVTILKGNYISGTITPLLDEISDARWFTVDKALQLPLAYEIKKHLLCLHI